MSRTIAAARRLVMPIGMSGWQSRWFDGVDDRIQGAGVPLSGDVAYTLAAWLRETRSLGATGIALQSGNNVANESAWIGVDGAGRFAGGHTGGSVLTGGNARDRGWHRVCVTKLAGADWPILYVDGAQVSIAGLGSTLAGAGAPFLGRSASGTAPFPGNIWDARIYSRAWSPAEVAQDYLGEWVNPTGLVRWWKLEDLTTATAREEIGGTNDAVTGALISTMAPFRLRRAVEDVPAAPVSSLTIPDHVDLRPEMQSCGWMQWTGKSVYNSQRIFGPYKMVGGDVRPFYQHNNGRLTAYMQDAAGNWILPQGPDISNLHGWIHTACTIDRATNTLYLFLDGSLVTSTSTATINTLSPTSSMVVGTNPLCGFNDVLWRKGAVFTPEEIRAHYLHGTIPAGLTSHWPCREGAGTAIHDIVGGHDGVLSAPSWTTKTRGHAREVAPARDAA